MRKRSVILSLLLILSLALCVPASAETCITAMAIEINPEHLEMTSSYARIRGYDPEKNVLRVELIVPERFAYQEVDALQPGDSIYTNGQEVLIRTITKHWSDTELNEGGEDAVYLAGDQDGNYRPLDGDDFVWLSVAEIECPVTDSLLFLDYIDESDGGMLELPVVHTAGELTAHIVEEGAENAFTVGFTANNVYVVFDEEGRLCTVHRFYVPWQ